MHCDGTTYALAGSTCRVNGHLDARWAAWCDGVTITHDGDGATTLTGVVADQAVLYGLISRARDLGLVLIAVVWSEPEVEHRDDACDKLSG